MSESDTLDVQEDLVQADLRGVLLPMQNSQLLLPNVTVSEVISYRETDEIANAPDWLVGSITWRQRKVPVVAFEYFLENKIGTPGYRARIALCHNITEKPKMPFVGIICNSIPKLARVSEETIEENHLNELLPEMTLKHFSYNDEETWIPDLELLSELASSYLFK